MRSYFRNSTSYKRTHSRRFNLFHALWLQSASSLSSFLNSTTKTDSRRWRVFDLNALYGASRPVTPYATSGSQQRNRKQRASFPFCPAAAPRNLEIYWMCIGAFILSYRHIVNRASNVPIHREVLAGHYILI